MVEFEPAIKALTEGDVEFVIIGGVAISVHSSGYVTKDLDFCYLRTTENLKKIVSAFTQFRPRPRGFPEDLPFIWMREFFKTEQILPFKLQSAKLICSVKLMV